MAKLQNKDWWPSINKYTQKLKKTKGEMVHQPNPPVHVYILWKKTKLLQILMQYVYQSYPIDYQSQGYNRSDNNPLIH